MIKPERKIFLSSDLNPAEYNPRFISHNAADGLKTSLDKFGYIQDIIVNIRDDKNTIVGGHKRLETLKLDPSEEIECTIVDLDEQDEKALNIALNSGEISGEFDEDKLKEILIELKSDYSDYYDLNFDDLADTLGIEFGDEEKKDIQESVNNLKQAIQLKPPREYVLIMCEEESDEFDQLKVLLDLQPVRRGGYKEGSAFDAVGTQRIIKAENLIERFKNADSCTE